MFFLKGRELGYEKRIDDGVVVYEVPDYICEKDMELSTINSIVDDFRGKDYKAIVIDGSKKVVDRMKCYVPFAKDGMDRKKAEFEGDYRKHPRLRMAMAFGVYSLINYGLGYHISANLLKLENPLVGSVIIGTSSLAALASGFALEKYNVIGKKEKIMEDEENLEMLECALNMSVTFSIEEPGDSYA